MARRYGRLNPYRSRIRRCALSGLRGYQDGMVHYHGNWYLPRWRDEDMAAKGRRSGHRAITDPWTQASTAPETLTLQTDHWVIT